MTKKKYRSILAVHLSIGITVKGQPMTIDFDGGANGLQKILPYYITSNPDIQAALEASSGFNQYYRLEKVETTPDEVVEPVVPEAPSTPVVPEVPEVQPTPEVPDVFGDKGDVTDLETPTATDANQSFGGITPAEVTNGQDAKAYLMARFTGQVGQMPNKPAILNEANRLGVTFPNWK